MILKLIYYLLFSGIFYLVYRGLYSQMSFHRVNRWTLMLIPPASILIAFIAPEFSLPFSSSSLLEIELPEVFIEGKRLETIGREQSIPSIWTTVYWTGILLSILYFISGLWLLFKVLRGSESSRHKGRNISYSPLIKSAFTFGNYILIPENLRNDPKLETLIEHEVIHMQMGHSWDRIYYKILSTALWFDPFIHLFSKELRQVHEFEVDAQLVEENNIENYAHMLLSSTLGADLAYPEKALSPSPFFNSSLIKSRITMM